MLIAYFQISYSYYTEVGGGEREGGGRGREGGGGGWGRGFLGGGRRGVSVNLTVQVNIRLDIKPSCKLIFL